MKNFPFKNRLQLLFLAAVSAQVILLAVSPRYSVAEYIEPELVKVKTEQYKPSNVNLPRGNYVYQISWQGLPVARAEVKVTDKDSATGSMVSTVVTARTGSFIDVFYKLRHESASIFRSDSFHPVIFRSYQRENSKIQTREINFKDDGTVFFKEERKGRQTKEKTFDPNNLIFDPISAVFFARSIQLKVGDKVSFDVFNGKHRYLITFDAVAKEKLALGGSNFDTVKLVPTVKKLTDTEGEKKLHSATIWVTDDEHRQILKLESSVFVGSVSAALESFTPEVSKNGPLSSTVQALRLDLNGDSRIAVAEAQN